MGSRAAMPSANKNRGESGRRRLRLAVVGLGRIARNAVLPAFARAPTCRLAALVSGNPRRRTRLARKYGAEIAVGYEDYGNLLSDGAIDAVYIALPNELHAEYVLRALRAGVHVLCEKPLATTLADAKRIAQQVRRGRACLMTAYRLNFEPATLRAREIARSGRLGALQYFSSTYSIRGFGSGDIRLRPESGGAVADLGVYCINAARHFFGAEPVEAFALADRGRDPKKPTAVLLRFPGGRLGIFTVAFNTPYTAEYRLVGTKGILEMNPGYAYKTPLRLRISTGSWTSEKTFPKTDQFRDELEAFSAFVRSPGRRTSWADEGVADVSVIAAIGRSLREGAPVRVVRG
jgi:glucose-fructose oxidoreductase